MDHFLSLQCHIFISRLGTRDKIYIWIDTDISSQTCGWCLGYILFTTLESAGYITFSQVLLFSFCATQIISPHHIFCFFWSNPDGLYINRNSLTSMCFNFQFLFFWGIVFLVTTTLIGYCLKIVSWKCFPFSKTCHGNKKSFPAAIFKREKNSAGASAVGPDGEYFFSTHLNQLLCNS